MSTILLGSMIRKIKRLHVLVIIGALLPIPYGSFFLPLFYWWIRKKDKDNNYFNTQAKNILNFQLLFSILGTIYLIFFWHYFIEVKIEKFNEINYEFLWYFIAIAIIVNILYPIFIIIKMAIENKPKIYYPNIIHFF